MMWYLHPHRKETGNHVPSDHPAPLRKIRTATSPETDYFALLLSAAGQFGRVCAVGSQAEEDHAGTAAAGREGAGEDRRLREGAFRQRPATAGGEGERESPGPQVPGRD